MLIKYIIIVIFISHLFEKEGFSVKVVEGPLPREEIIKKVKEEFPINEWKIVGLAQNKKPLLHIKVPSFLNWDKSCDGYFVDKKGVAYCGASEFIPTLNGILKFGSYEAILKVSLEATLIKKPKPSLYDLTIFDPDWGEYGAILEKKAIYLGGYEAYLGEIEDVNGTLKKPTKAMTLIYYKYPLMGGKMYLVESRKVYGATSFTPHNERVFQYVIDEIIKSNKFLVPVEDEKNRAEFKYLKRK